MEDFDRDNILIYEKSHEDFLINDISYKTLIGSKLLRITFDKIHGFIGIYDGTRYLTLFGSEKHDAVCNRIRYLISIKISITNIYTHYYAKIIAHPCDVLPIEKFDFVWLCIVL